MKKKIINGILMAAMLFAGTTSFVSCKDNVDDTTAAVYKDLDKVKKDLQEQIDDCKDRLDKVEKRCSDLEDTVKAIRQDLIATQARVNSLETRMDNVEDSIAAHTKRMNEISDKIDDILKNAIYDVKVQETIDNVIGTINMPGISVWTLMSYYGLNASGLTIFPTTDPKMHAYYTGEDLINAPNGQYPYDKKYAAYGTTEEGPWIGKVKQIRFEGLGGQLSMFKNNVGKIYFSMNPKELDIETVKNIDIVDSKGNTYPYEITGVRGSDHDLTFAIGKHGEILNEGETDNTYLYEADVHLPMEKWYQAISYNLDDTWKVLGKMNEISTMINKVKEAKNESGKTAASKVLIKEALQWIQNQYQETYTNKYKMKYQALRVQGKYNTATSENKIVVAAVEPLSYKTFFELDVNGKAAIKANVDVETLEKAVATALKVIGKKASEVKGNIQASGQTFTLDGVTVTAGQMSLAMIKAIVDNIPYANNILASLKNVYHSAAAGDNAAVGTSISNFLSKVSAKLASFGGEYYFFNTVAPIVLFQGAEGIDRLQPGMTINANGHVINLILTSPTEEYLVPAMYKYIAVRHGDQIVDAKLLDGHQKVIDLNVKYSGESEIIYQTVDYAGYVVTKTYPVTFE